ncbi:MAG: nucleoside deaminase [Oscillospiraceae bacterium]|nr:nucleoside deaminase [Candidatus Equicaccousia limihippi]
MNAIFMNDAISQAKIAKENDEVPVGAVIVKDGEIIARAHNLTKTKTDATAHAEMLCIKAAQESLKTDHLFGCELYVTLEPCPMCAGAIINSKISELIYGASDPKGGAVDSLTNLFSLPFNHRPTVYGAVKEAECKKLLQDFFANKR